MPLNEDPDAMSDDEYWALFDDAEPCPHRVPEDALAEALARLDDFADYKNGAPPHA